MQMMFKQRKISTVSDSPVVYISAQLMIQITFKTEVRQKLKAKIVGRRYESLT